MDLKELNIKHCHTPFSTDYFIIILIRIRNTFNDMYILLPLISQRLS